MSSKQLYAGVIVDVKAEAVDRIFTYRIPPHLNVEVGHRVLVPFGPRRLEGYVINLTENPSISPDKIRDIARVLDSEPVILPSLMELALWMRGAYHGLLSEALQYMLPPGVRFGRERVGVKVKQVVRLLSPNPELSPRATAQRRMVEMLRTSGPMEAAELVKGAGGSYQALQALEKKGVVAISHEQVERRAEWDEIAFPAPALTPAQTQACADILAELAGEGRPVLLHGVTGSGKTEVYLQIIKRVLDQGKQALVLVPEIALTPQTVSRFGSRFGESIAVLHSGLSDGERHDEWWRIFRGEAEVVIGARSAVFAPLKRLGLIVIDEEHEGTYKQSEGSIRYHTRAVAEKRAELAGALVVLGSATPSVESYHRAIAGTYRLVSLPERVEQRPLPKVELVDMRAEFEAGNRSMLSRSLHQALQHVLQRQEQAIILLNRRGFSAFVLCRECGHVLQCENCSVSMTYHKADGKMHCHYCTARQELPEKCPNCASRYLRQFGVGTEQVQEVLKKMFPQAEIKRMDADTTRRKGAHRAILKSFAAGRTHILIGTQMVAKGLDFPNVTLVGVLSADLSLNLPDIRASERTFQLLTQVAGRAGRGDRPGRVIIQCYDPAHFAIQAAKEHDYRRFFRQEISFRRQMGYPPFAELVRILCTGPEGAAEKHIRQIGKFLKDNGVTQDQLYGPAPAPIGKIKGRHRWQIVLKGDVHHLLPNLPVPGNNVHVAIDVDPLFLL
ncbi:MAG TPA: primosomal protein N' [Firmicutes bacterium]|nr:primosomal protein N' [Bacillota bacterium]